MPVGIAVFGLGRIGKIHLNILTSVRKVKVLYIVEKDDFLIYAKKYLDAENYEYTEDASSSDTSKIKLIGSSKANIAYSDKNVNAVYVCTPTDLHEAVVVEALENNKAVFCEKPLAPTLKSTIKCYQMAFQKKIPLLVAFNRRFDPQFKETERKLRANELGRLHQIRTVARDNPVPSYEYLKISGGIFHDCAVHDMDMCRFLVGADKEVVSIYVQAHAYDKTIGSFGDVDTVHIVMEFANCNVAASDASDADSSDGEPLHSSIDISRHGCYGYDQRCEIFGEKGLLCSENVRDSFITQSRARNLPDSTLSVDHGTVIAPVQFTFAQRYLASYTAELHHFLELIDDYDGTDSRVLHSDTILVSLLADCCDESHHTKTKVNFNEFVKAQTLKHLGKAYSVNDIKNNFSEIEQV